MKEPKPMPKPTPNKLAQAAQREAETRPLLGPSKPGERKQDLLSQLTARQRQELRAKLAAGTISPQDYERQIKLLEQKADVSVD